MNRHLNHDELLRRIYGLDDNSSPQARHLEHCSDCAARLAEFERLRADASPAPAISEAELASQRRLIYAQLDQAPHSSLRWTPALAAVFLFAMGLFLFEPSPRETHPAATHADLSDDQFFAEVYSIEQILEPQAAAPIHALFETPEESE